MKLARFKEVFAGPTKSDAVDARKILEAKGIGAESQALSTILPKCALARVYASAAAALERTVT